MLPEQILTSASPELLLWITLNVLLGSGIVVHGYWTLKYPPIHTSIQVHSATQASMPAKLDGLLMIKDDMRLLLEGYPLLLQTALKTVGLEMTQDTTCKEGLSAGLEILSEDLLDILGRLYPDYEAARYGGIPPPKECRALLERAAQLTEMTLQ